MFVFYGWGCERLFLYAPFMLSKVAASEEAGVQQPGVFIIYVKAALACQQKVLLRSPSPLEPLPPVGDEELLHNGIKLRRGRQSIAGKTDVASLKDAPHLHLPSFLSQQPVFFPLPHLTCFDELLIKTKRV